MTKLIFPGRYSSLSLLNRTLSGAKYKNSKFVILLDENSYTHCIPLLITKVPALEGAEFLEVPVGEEAKSLEIAGQIWGALQEMCASECVGKRDLVLINLGGGCVSDLGGFIAAGYKRGVSYINIPTTVIGMIDAGIGGKTAVNLEGVKNQIGFFHEPVITCIEPAFIDSLPNRELKNGICEMLKTFLIANPEAYEQMRTAIVKNEIPLTDEMIVECASIKQSVVKQDPKEQDIRKILNFGHTFGHAIEAYSKEIMHGEAVAFGMAYALYLSVKKLGLEQRVLTDYMQALKALMQTIPSYTLKDTESLIQLMRSDKKNSDGQIMCVLLQELGAPVIDVAVDENEIRDALLSLKKF